MELIISGVRFKACLGYLYYVLIFSSKLEDHIKHVYEVLTLLENAGVSLNPRRCQFFRKYLYYFGPVLLPGRIAIAKDSTDAIADSQLPEDLTQRRSFLSVCNIYRCFVKDFSHIDDPLNRWL